MPPAYICVDIETAGPTPGDYSMLSLGAATTTDPQHSFYVELQPVTMSETAEAAAVHGLSLDALARDGTPPAEAMKQFAEWVEDVAGADVPSFVAFNAPFDWMFVADYFQRYLGRNPFGHRALDIKALFMGMHNVAWRATDYRAVARHYGFPEQLPHHAGDDARLEAQVFAAMLADLQERAHT